MNLLVVSQYFYPEQFRINDVCSQLTAQGHNVTVLTGLPNYPAGEIFNGYKWQDLKRKAGEKRIKYDSFLKAFIENINGVQVIRCRLFPRGNGKISLLKNYLSFALYSAKTAKAMAKRKYTFDRIIVFQYSPVTMAIPGIIMKKKLKRPLILYCFDLWPESIVSGGMQNHGVIYDLALRLSKWIYQKADKIIISSRSFITYFNNALGIYNNIEYLPIYAEDLFYELEPGLVKTEKPQDVINLVFAGNIGEMQSVDTIIKAAELLKEHQNIKIHIVGGGSALNKNVKSASDLGLNNIIFHGRHPLEEMPKYYSLADAFLITLKANEVISFTLPNKVQTYMAAGKPILAAINGETADVIRESGCGLCCNAENYHELANLILQFCGEKEKHPLYGASAVQYYNKHFSVETFMDRFNQILMS